MQPTNAFSTERLFLEPLQIKDHNFVQELVNTPGWLQFIGNRHVHSQEEAIAYIERIIANPFITYWVVRLKEEHKPIGIVTLIKRDYLEHHDIGFAFLPVYMNKGYAYEAVQAVLRNAIDPSQHSHILATTIPANINSIRLLQKLGLTFNKEINVGADTLHVYSATTEHLVSY